MDLSRLQKEIRQNKVDGGFNVTDVGKEIVLMAEELEMFGVNSEEVLVSHGGRNLLVSTSR